MSETHEVEWADDIKRDALRCPPHLRKAALDLPRLPLTPEGVRQMAARFSALVCFSRQGKRADGVVFGKGGRLLHYRPREAALLPAWEEAWDALEAADAAHKAAQAGADAQAGQAPQPEGTP